MSSSRCRGRSRSGWRRAGGRVSMVILALSSMMSVPLSWTAALVTVVGATMPTTSSGRGHRTAAMPNAHGRTTPKAPSADEEHRTDRRGDDLDEDDCELLQSTLLTYHQDNAPRDISAVLRVVIERINRELSGVTNVEVKWTGGDALHRRVGTHHVRTLVTRSIDGEEEEDDDRNNRPKKTTTTQCFVIPIDILDTDECTLPAGHVMRHLCHPPSMCVNTIGGYECVCPLLDGTRNAELIRGLRDLAGNSRDGGARGEEVWRALIARDSRNAWELSLPPSTSSSSGSTKEASSTNKGEHGKAVCQVPSPSTASCCPSGGDAHSSDGAACRSTFRCPVDPCQRGKKHNDCVPQATCHRSASPTIRPNHSCVCPPGHLGNGRICPLSSGDAKGSPDDKIIRVKPDGTPLSDRVYCGCTEPVVDPCAGVICPGRHTRCVPDPSSPTTKHVCECREGFFLHPTLNECVDETPPVLKLKCDPDGTGISLYKQGDTYKECAVDIVDSNAEEYYRSLKIHYDAPVGRCFTSMGSLNVRYTIETPWTTPSEVSVTRTVRIEDVDECAISPDSRGSYERYRDNCPSVIPHCDFASGATCRNTVGSYECVCPPYTTGDGFVRITDYDVGIFDGKKKYKNGPVGYVGGTGCKDTTIPVIKLRGPDPKVFKIGKVSPLKGALGIDSSREGLHVAARARNMMREQYESEIRYLVESTRGAELCATTTTTSGDGGHGGGSSHDPVDCVYAYDKTYNDTVDLSSRVVLGDLVPASSENENGGSQPPNTWKIPYDVMDDAGNAAKTVWRTIVVEEVDWTVLEEGVEVLRDELEKQKKINKDISAGAAGGRRGGGGGRGAGTREAECPKCPPCECNSGPVASRRGDSRKGDCDCEAYCRSKYPQILGAGDGKNTCPQPPQRASGPTVGEKGGGAALGPGTTAPGGIPGIVIGMLHHAQDALYAFETVAPPVVSVVITCTVAVIVLVATFKFVWMVFVRPRRVMLYEEDRERRALEMAGAVTYYRSPSPQHRVGTGTGGGGERRVVGGTSRGEDEDLYAQQSRAEWPRRHQPLSSPPPPRATRMFSPDGSGVAANGSNGVAHSNGHMTSPDPVRRRHAASPAGTGGSSSSAGLRRPANMSPITPSKYGGSPPLSNGNNASSYMGGASPYM